MMIAVMPALRLLGQDGHAGSSSRLMNDLAVGHREQHLEALGAPALLGHRAAEVALEALAIEHLDPGDVALVELLAELGVGELLGRIALPAHHLEQGERQQAHQQPERQVLAQVPPVGARGSVRESVCHLFQVRNEREMSKVLGVIESVADQKGRWRLEPDETEFRTRLGRQLLVQERADREALRAAARSAAPSGAAGSSLYQ